MVDFSSQQIADLKKGDEVGVLGSLGDGVRLARVDHRTKTHIVLTDGTRYNLKGRQIYMLGSWSRGHLVPTEDANERLAEITKRRERHADLRALRETDWHKLTDGQLVSIRGVVQAYLQLNEPAEETETK